MLTDVLQAKAERSWRSTRATTRTPSSSTTSGSPVRWRRSSLPVMCRASRNDNPALTGNFPVVGGMRWLSSPNIPTANTVLALDSTDQLGGMADEDLGGPGYVSTDGVGVQAKTIREDENDQWRLRCRRVTVPVVVEPAAGYKITGA
jgi:hypothetical protein